MKSSEEPKNISIRNTVALIFGKNPMAPDDLSIVNAEDSAPGASSTPESSFTRFAKHLALAIDLRPL